MFFSLSNSVRTALIVLLTVVATLAVVFMLPNLRALMQDEPVTEEAVPEEGVMTISYDIPTAEEVAVATGYEATVPTEQFVPGSTTIPLPLNVVNQDYIAAFNELIEAAAAMENHLKDDLAPAMLRVQSDAAAGNFMQMFEAMVDARASIAELDAMLPVLDRVLADYRRAYQAPGMPLEVRLNSEALDRAVVKVRTETETFSTLVAQTVDGTVPSQQLISDTESANLRVVAAAAEVAKSIDALSASIAANAR